MIPERLDQITDLQAKQICDELREQIIDSVSKTGGGADSGSSSCV